MASTITLANTINFVQGFVALRPLTGVGGVATEPGVTMANQIKQFILGPPFTWRWNRGTATFPTVIGQQDYAQALTDFGWLEKASVNDGTTTYEIQVELVLGDASEKTRPSHIAAYLDDNAGNITFRLTPVPEAIYTVKIAYQKKATLFTATTGTWAPIPDEFSYLYTKGFHALAYELADDNRALPEMTLFLRQVIAAAEGLKESEKNLFLESIILGDQRQSASAMLGAQQGRASRGL